MQWGSTLGASKENVLWGYMTEEHSRLEDRLTLASSGNSSTTSRSLQISIGGVLWKTGAFKIMSFRILAGTRDRSFP